MKKHITKYYESNADGLVTCTFEILDIESDRLVSLYIEKIKKEYPSKWIRMLVIKGKNIKCDLWLLSIENSIEEINNFKKNAINDLIYQKEFIFADETIIGDGSI